MEGIIRNRMLRFKRLAENGSSDDVLKHMRVWLELAYVLNVTGFMDEAEIEAGRESFLDLFSEKVNEECGGVLYEGF